MVSVEHEEYFAYGSNLDPVQMKERCISAVKSYVAKLPDHVLDFPRRSEHRKGGVASVTTRVGSAVWGVVFAITPADLEKLDRHEGYRGAGSPELNAYNRQKCIVHEAGDPSKPRTVWTYVANPMGDYLPHRDYLALICRGARHWKLPEDYLNELSRIKVCGE